jgi:hypothetical protein
MAQQIHHPKLEINLAAIMEKPPRQAAPKGLGVAWKAEQPKEAPRIAFVVTTSDSLQQIRVWISYHRAIGVTTFYIFADGQVCVRGVCCLRALRHPGCWVLPPGAAGWCPACPSLVMPPLHCVSSIAACHAPPALCANLQAARADNVAALRALPGVTVVLRDAELKRRHEASRQVAGPMAKWRAVCSAFAAHVGGF